MTCLLYVIRRPWQSASHLSMGRHMASLENDFHLSIGRHISDVLGKVLSLCIYDVFGKVLPIKTHKRLKCFPLILSIGLRTISLAKCFTIVYRTSYDLLSLNSDVLCILVCSKFIEMNISDQYNVSSLRNAPTVYFFGRGRLTCNIYLAGSALIDYTISL